jgi:hypothetical protein
MFKIHALYKARELTVPLERLEAATQEAEKLPSLEITELDLQWVQVRYNLLFKLK